MGLRLLALACLVGAALAGPFQRDVTSRCSQECSPTSDKFSYQVGKNYVYNYKGSNYISVAGGRKQQKAEISGEVEIHVKDQCEMALQLRDVRIQHSSDESTQSLTDKLESSPLHFSWSDGNITDVCPSESESPVSLNIKKAILSSLVNTMSDLSSFSTYQEVDSLGSCATEYSSRGEYRGVIKVHKEKSLKSCDNRHSGVSAVIANPYQSQESDIRSIPIFTDEKLECDQEIQDGIIQKSVCTESASFKPMSKHDSMADFKGVISLTLQTVKSSRGLPKPAELKRDKILYSYSQKEQVESKEKEVEDILSQLCTETKSIIHPSVSKMYYNLISAIRFLSGESIERVYEDLKSQRICDSPKTMDIYLDALPMAGNEGAIKLMVRLIRQKEITGLKAKVWPASLSLIPNPTAEAVAAVAPLLSGEHRSSPVLLGVSAMIYRICSSRDCNQIESVRRVVDQLHRSLGERCSSDNDEEVISVLKAFGNMGFLGDAEDSVIQCATSRDKSINVRLAAIDAFRRTQGKRPSQIVTLFSDASENYEVRIAALVGAVKHPQPSLFQIIERVMESEHDEQVAAFTQSLLRNLNSTSSPLKQEHRRMSQTSQIKEQDVGYWENSKNIELSAFNRPLNLGGSIESNIIHAPGSKLPRSGSTRIDIDLFGKNINLLEFGMRAEGLESAVKKLLGMDDQQSQKSWLAKNLLKSSSSSESGKPEASFYLRTMDTEILDLSASDLTSVGNMMQYADVLNKLAQGEKADFAHSFMFADTKIVIPSVTGRSYALSFVGTTTVGLSADGKFDVINLMSSPKNCDIKGRFQPSANVELAATVGIHTEKSRPDVKIVTTFHSESDVEAKLMIKDGHLLEAKWNLPSQKVQLLKLSTNVYEIDSDNVEKPLLEEMQTKLDHCTKSLVKPLGIEICGKVEIPHPFVGRTFPFAKGFGNIELSLKKTDPSMKGYEMSIEIPRRKSNSMVYRMSIDTPGSRVQRKISVKLETKQPASGENEFEMELESPFKSISASGSLVKKPSQIQGAIEVLTDKSRRYSMKALIETSSSGSERTIKPSIQWTLPNSDPVTLSGSVTHVQGRKQQLTFDLKSNKPSDKPIVLTGTIMKDGRLGFSKDSEWRLSSDLVAKFPWVSMKIRSTADKQSHQSKSISTTLSIDYQTSRSRRQTIRFTSKGQQKDSGKLSASAQLEASEKPSCNWFLSWDMQGNPMDTMKNDLVLKYGENPEQSNIHIHQMSKRGDQNSLSEAKVSLKAPHLRIDNELKVSADLNFKRTSNFHVETDLRYSQQKHIKSLIKLQSLSQKPLKMIVNAELEIPGRKMSYRDEIQETSQNEYSGHSQVQWSERQQASLQYKYRKLSSRSTIHHEIESTLQTPSLSAPLKHKATLQLNSESFQLENRMQIGRKPDYFVTAAIQRQNGPSEISVRLPRIEGSLQLQNDRLQKSVSLDVKSSSSSPRHVKASGQIRLGQKKSIECEISLDAERNPSSKISFSSEAEYTSERSGRSYSVATHLQYLDALNMKMESKGKRSLEGPHSLMVDVSGRSFEPVTLNIQHQASSSDIRSTISYEKSHTEKAKVELQGKYLKRSSGNEISGGISLKSRDGSWEEREFSFSHVYSKSSSALNSKSDFRLQTSSNRLYSSEVELSHQSRRSTDLKMQVSTPFRQFPMQKFEMSHRRSEAKHSLEASVEYGSSKKVSLVSSLDKTRYGMSCSWALTTPSSAVREAKFSAAYDNQRSKKEAESHFELNRKRMFETTVQFEKQPRGFEFRSHFQAASSPKLQATVRSESDDESYKHEATLLKDSRKVLSGKIYKQMSRKDVKYALEIEDSQKSLVDISASKELKGTSTKYSAKAKGPFTPVSVSIQTTRNDENSVSVTAGACKESSRRECYNAKMYYKKEENSSKYRKYRKITLDLERSSGQSSGEHICNIHYLFADSERSLKSKFVIEAKQKKAGLEMQLIKQKSEQEPGSFDINVIMPSRSAKASLSYIRNAQRQSYELEIVPDVSATSQKLSAVLKSEKQNGQRLQENQVTGHVQLNLDVLEKPLEIRFEGSQSPSKWPVSGKVEIDYSRNPADKLTAEMQILTDRSQTKRQQFLYKIYSGDKDIDLEVQVLKSRGMPNESTKQYGWQWTWKPQSVHVTGGLLVTLDHDRSLSTPCITNVTYYSPSSTITLLGKTQWSDSIPVETNWQLIANDQLLGKAEFHKEGPCSELEITQNGPLWKTRVCAQSSDERGEKRLSVQCHYKSRKCVEFQTAVNPSQWQISSLDVHWQKQELLAAARSLKEMSLSLSDPELEKIESEIVQKSKRIHSSLKRKVYLPIKNQVKSQIREFLEKQTQKLRRHQQSIKELVKDWPSWEEIHDRHIAPVMQSLKRQIQEVQQKIQDNLPEELKEIFEKMKKTIEKYMEEVCSRGSFCYEVKMAYHRRGLKQVQQVVQQKIKKVAETSYKQFPNGMKWYKITMRRIKDALDTISNRMERIMNSYYRSFPSLKSLFDRLKEKSENLKRKLERLYEELKRKAEEIIADAAQNEDVQVLISAVTDAKDEIKKQWQQTNFQKVFKPVPAAVLEAVIPTHWIKEKISFNSDLKNGSFQLQMKQPFDHSQITLVKNAFIFMKNKYQQSGIR